MVSLDRSGTPPPGVEFIACNVAIEGQITDAVTQLIARHGRIDILLNNAGIGGIGPIASPDGPGDMAAFRGVIEVNLQPTASWAELRDVTRTLYDLAHEARLGTEKFDLDGLHTGTGGGNHLTLGGPTPERSPMLQRPDLLVSMLTFWQHHPSLSYLFSGRFVGPTSQAPRADEGRPESLYELEIAFAELQKQTAPGAGRCPPWLIDRLAGTAATVFGHRPCVDTFGHAQAVVSVAMAEANQKCGTAWAPSSPWTT